MRLGGREYPLVGPDIRDPRLHVALVVVSLQVLGQTVLHFDISIAQILIGVVTCALMELGITAWRHQVIAWPSSALLTGNGVAFVLRVPGTQHGDWWSVRGGWIFAAVGVVSLLSKYLIRVGGRPLFNPSNFGLLLGFLVLGSRRADPLDFWWVRPGVALTLALTVIVVGGLFLAWRVSMFGVVASFWLAYAAALSVLAARGHCITARWHVGPVCDQYFWTVLVTSPEVLVFMFFMITDPKTVPRGRKARIAYGAAIGLVFVMLAAPQRTEFATKVALLGSLALVCAARPLLERLSPIPGSDTDRLAIWFGFDRPASRSPSRRRRVQRVATAVVIATAYSAIVVGAGASARTSNVTSASGLAPTGCTNRGAASVAPARPTVRAQPLPAVRVTNAINVATSISTQSAKKIVRDVIDDLAIGADAIEHHRPELAGDVARSPWRDSLISTICATAGPLIVSTYHFDNATVTATKRATGQRSPEIDVTLQGERRETTLTRSAHPRQMFAHTTPFRNTFVVSQRGGYWLICGYRADPRTASCVTAT
jgi:Na+-translocating ferredoxin:NAD+ oxidoreductase RnfD subunit